MENFQKNVYIFYFYSYLSIYFFYYFQPKIFKEIHLPLILGFSPLYFLKTPNFFQNFQNPLTPQKKGGRGYYAANFL